MELHEMRKYRALLTRYLDIQAEAIVDRISNWEEGEILECIKKCQVIMSSEDPVEEVSDLEAPHFRQLAMLASIGLQDIVRRILDKDIFLEEEME